MEAWVNGGFREYQIRETDKALTTMEARGIQHNVFQQGQLAYFYDSGREVPVGCFGYHRITKREALADWPAYMHKAQPSEIEWMETLGYTPAVRAFLKTCPDFGVGLKIDIEYTCVPGRIDWAYEVLGLQGDPIWEFLKAKAVQMMQWEDKLKKMVMEDDSRKRNPFKCWH
ncbi:g8459 [Coccomyxa viridis]|uniref:G8459 protein n=1 Tax=Coccomyxa viridis TaxID=1274662 RepID=A0ABP1G317_9CHLO